MTIPEMIERINQLARKQRGAGLTDAERAEQAVLRRMYIDNIKDQIRVQIDVSKSSDHDKNCHCGCHDEQ